MMVLRDERRASTISEINYRFKWSVREKITVRQGFVDFDMEQRERSDLGRRVQIKNIYLVFSNT